MCTPNRLNLLGMTASDYEWQPDILGKGFQQLVIPLGADPVSEGGEGDIFATLVRYAPADQPTPTSRPAVLFVHGMTDYFFQRHVAQWFHQHGFSVYALDLRKCGRSHRNNQSWHYISDISRYFEELDRAKSIIEELHPTIFPIGHSTGGLILAHWLDSLRQCETLHPTIPGAILNSPWLDMMTPAMVTRALRPILTRAARRFPHASFGRSKEGTYGRSLHASRSGEWDYDISFKPLTGHLRKLGWLHAIDTAQSLVHNDAVDCGIPLLMLCSDHSSLRGKFSPRAQVTDTVLDVEQMKRWAPHLSEYVSVCTIRGAVHDVYLSQKPARLQALETSVRWMNTILSEHTI